MNKILAVLIMGVISLNTYLCVKSIDDKKEISRLRQTLVDYGFAEYKTIDNTNVEYVEYPEDYGTYADCEEVEDESLVL